MAYNNLHQPLCLRRRILKHRRSRLMRRLSLSLVFIAVSACSTLKTKGAQLESLSRKFHRLPDQVEVQCEVRPKLSEPLRALWLKDTKVGRHAVTGLDSVVLSWRATPARCLLQSGNWVNKGDNVLMESFVKQAELALCLWFQSFYGESPIDLAQSPPDKWEQEGSDWVLRGRSGKFVAIREDGAQVKAVIGLGQTLTAEFSQVADLNASAWLPSRIEFLGRESYGELYDLSYRALEERIFVPSQFWLRTGEDASRSQSLARLEFSMCRAKELSPLLR